MPVIDLTADEMKTVRRIILLRPRPARLHRKAAILFALSRSDDIRRVCRRCRTRPETVDRVLAEFRSKGLEPTLTPDGADEHRERSREVERHAPGREKFRSMLERFPAPDRWLDDDDWDL
jgi:hypothetical protein